MKAYNYTLLKRFLSKKHFEVMPIVYTFIVLLMFDDLCVSE